MLRARAFPSSPLVPYIGSDATAVFREIASSGVEGLIIPAGTYISDAVVWPENMKITATGRVRIVAKNTMSAISHLWTFGGGSSGVEGIEFEGAIYSAFGDSIYPYSLVRFESSPVSTGTTSGYVRECMFDGGLNGVLPRNVTRFTAEENEFYRQYTVGISNLDGFRQSTIRKNIIRETGVNSGIVVGSFAQQTDTDFEVSGNTVLDCGRLDPTTSNWQEGIDLFSTSSSVGRVADNIIRRCGNGGIELKTSATGLSVLPQTYDKIVVEHNTVEVDADLRPGIVCNWVGTYATPDKASKITIRDNNLYYTGTTATGSSSSAIIVNAYTNTLVEENVIDGFYAGINLIGDGSSDATNRRSLVKRNEITGGTIGIKGGTGTLENCTIEGNDIEALAYAISLTNATITNLRIVNNPRLVATSTSLGSVYGINVQNDTGTVIEGNNRIEGGNEAIYGSGGNVSAVIRNNGLVSRKTHGARLDNYTSAEFVENRVTPASTSFRSHVSTGTVVAAMNVMGYAAVIPTGAGAVGDVFLSSAPGAGAVGWVCSVAGNSGAATWVAF